MNTRTFLSLIFVTVLLGCFDLARAQRAMPKVIENTTYSRPVPSSKPVFLRDTLEVQLQTKETYWKVPNQNYYTSWIPRANFHLVYDGCAKLRYTAEWFNSDGSPWFTEALTYMHGGEIASIRRDYSDEHSRVSAFHKFSPTHADVWQEVADVAKYFASARSSFLTGWVAGIGYRRLSAHGAWRRRHVVSAKAKRERGKI